MEVIKLKIEDIKPYENNAKLHPQEQIEQIKKSIQEFGFNDPLGIDENNVIIEGNGRYEALKQLGYEEVECIRLSNLTEEQKRAYILIHNKLTMNTGFDLEMLSLELSKIDSIDMTEFDFDELSLEETDVELPREERGTAENLPSIKFGSKTIYMTEEESERLENIYKNFLELNGNVFNFVNTLIDGGGTDYEN